MVYKPRKHGFWSHIFSLVFVFGFFLSALTTVIYHSVFKESRRVSISANAVQLNSEFQLIQGRILFQAEPVYNVTVIVDLVDSLSHKSPLSSTVTNKSGEFLLDSIPTTIGNRKVTEIEINAKGNLVVKGDSITVSGTETITISGKGSQEIVKISIWVIVILPAIFLLSFIVPFLTLSPRWKYGFSISLAIILTLSMIIAISGGISNINKNYSSDTEKVISLGYASLFHGTYVEGVPSEWLFSITSLQLDTKSDNSGNVTVKGFGVPLWVLLIAVVGAGLLTVSIIVSEIKDRPKFHLIEKNVPDDEEFKEFRARLERIVRHQFYILFSPIGAIFVYQMLVTADAAYNSTTVALAAFGAGASLNVILDYAITSYR